ncbi:MAG: L-glutamate gamma-semialdehyde dehydrogenase [Bacteroidetes bacterium]|nr:L-glutamate gamma-semialdehyde dehydrogenase [Bacteroidota bacterium]
MKPYTIESYLDFNNPTYETAQKAALDTVRKAFGNSYPLYINGKRTQGEKESFPSINPSNTDEVVGIFESASKAQALEALDAAWQAFESWQYVSAEKRAAYLFKAADIARRRRLEINAWMISEAGKNFAEADADTAEGIDFLEYYAHEALRYDKGMDVVENTGGDVNRTIYVPLGAGVSISPWNFPFAICLGMAAAPIVAGNTVVAKPAPDTPMMGWIIAEIFEEAGLPPGVFNFVTGDNLEVGETLTASKDTRFINFTGSLGVGQHITEIAAKRDPGNRFIKRVFTELGGKNAIVVDEDANVDEAANEIVKGAFGFQGQKCSAASRVIVHEAVYDELLEKTLKLASALQVGDVKTNAPIGPVINQKAVDKIMGYIEIGKSEGRLVLGGKRAETGVHGYYIEPTIFADVPRDARIAQEEIFGPVTAFIKAKDLDDAFDIANSTQFGLTGGFFSKNKSHIDRALREFHVGNLYINRKNTGALVGAQPFGGFNLSGTDSKAGGRDYLLCFLQAKSLTERPLYGDTQVLGFSYSKSN